MVICQLSCFQVYIINVLNNLIHFQDCNTCKSWIIGVGRFVRYNSSTASGSI